MRPWIGIVGELVEGERTEVRLSLRYAAAVEQAGGRPFVVAYPRAEEAELAVEELVARVDGLLFSGGDDFDTARLGLGPTHPAAKPVPARKQDFDFALARHALTLGVPMLGICYGMQLLGLVGGGALFQHLPEDRPGARPHSGGVKHEVALAEGTKLQVVAGVGRLDVVSRHHQALASVGPGWRASAHDAEGLIEGLECARGFALGVQWHPELSSEPGHARLFEGLVAAARARRPSPTPAGAHA
jgi:putative glutamine amidotransferase